MILFVTQINFVPLEDDRASGISEVERGLIEQNLHISK